MPRVTITTAAAFAGAALVAVVAVSLLADSVHAQSSTTWEYRLAGGTSTSGRLEARASSTEAWGTVCDDSFGSADATVACRSLGLSTSSPSYSTATSSMQGSSSQPTNMDNLACTGTEATLDACSFIGSASENCAHSEDIVMSCPASTWEYRLAGGTSTSGRLEARASSTAAWGTVCDDSFGSADATVACRSLGFSTTGATYSTATSSMQGSSSQPTNMDNLACTGTEAQLDSCSFIGSASENCAHSEDIVLTCPGGSATATTAAPATTASSTTWEYRLAGGTSTSGRLEARASSTAAWGTVCDDSFGSADATVACRSLGFSTTGASYSTATSSMQGSSSQPTNMDNLACTGTEATLDACSFIGSASENCAHSEDIVLTCPGGSATATTAAPATTSSWEYRLAGGTSTSGRLEARSSSSGTWGTICDDFFGSTDATVACRSLGLPTTGATYSTVTSSLRGTTSQPTNMDNLACTGTEATLDACSFVGSSAEDCSYVEAIALSCPASGQTSAPLTPAPPPPPAVTSSTGWGYRLVGSGNSGRLETRPSSSASWGTVCDDFFGTVDARVACASLGLNSSSVSYRTVTSTEQGSSSQLIYMDNLGCTGTEATLDRCTFIGSTGENCAHSEDVFLSCGADAAVPATPAPPVALPYVYRLTGGATANTGRLEVRQNTSLPWATVCDDYFGAPDATVACRSLGYADGTTTATYSTATSALQGSTTQPIAWQGLLCRGTEARLDLCSTTSSACTHSEDVVITCTVSQWQYRLSSGTSSTSGRLEARPSSSASWGTVCDDSFGSADATVACRSLGLSSTGASYRTVTTAERGSSTQLIYMDNLGCTGSESQLDSCYYIGSSAENCAHSEDIFLSCGAAATPWLYRLADGTTTFGRLETRPNTSVAWGTVCRSGFTTTAATVACRALGFSTSTTAATASAASSSTAGAGSSSQPIWLGGVLCTGTEARPELCSASPSGTCSSHSNDVAIACTPQQTSAWEYRLVGSASGSGRLETRPSDTAAWGTVCDDFFGATDAAVACRSLGFGADVTATYRTVTTAERGSSSQLIYMDDLGCRGTEASLDSCSFLGSSRENCAHSEDVFLTCSGATVATNPDSYQVRLENSPTFGRGRIGIRPNASEAWGYVCRTSFDDLDAAAACRSLGFSGDNAFSIGSYANSASADENKPAWMNSVACLRTSPRIQDCEFSTATTGCSIRTTAAGIDCVTGNYEYRLVPAGTDRATIGASGIVAGATSGLLEARMNGSYAWGKVCHVPTLTQSAANAACRSAAGERFGLGSWSQIPTSDASVLSATAMVNLRCDVGAQSLTSSACRFEAPSSTAADTCTSAIYLSCATPPPTRQPAGGFAVRQLQGPVPGRGIVVVSPLATRDSTPAVWGSVCQRGMTTTVAGRLCRAMGYRVSEAAWLPAIGNPQAQLDPILVGRTLCLQRDVNFTDCTVSMAAHTCTQNDVVEIDCLSASVEFRLVDGGSTAAGRLETRRNTSVPWGTVCGLGFGAAEARVACRSLGFSADTVASILPRSSAPDGASTQPISFTRTICRSTESSLTLCNYSTATRDACSHSDDVRVACGASSAQTGCAGPSSCGDWILVGRNVRPNCAATTTLQAGSVGALSHSDCRRNATGSAAARSGSGAVAAYVMHPGRRACDVFACAFTAGTVEPTSASAFEGTYRLYSPLRADATEFGFCNRQVSCSGNGAAQTTTVSRLEPCVLGSSDECQTEATLPPETAAPRAWDWRLADGSFSGVGRLEGRPSTGADWGTVCQTGFGTVDARVACSSLGFATTTATAYRTVAVSERANTSAPVYMSNVACTGAELRLDICTHTSLSSVASTCTHATDVWLVCASATTAAPQTSTTGAPGGTTAAANGTSAATSSPATTTAAVVAYEYRLVNVNGAAFNESTTLGRMEARPSATAAWGTVCDDAFGTYDAHVACRSLGWTSYTAAYADTPSSLDGNASQPIYFDDVGCNGAESALDRCSFIGEAQENCAHSEDIHISCAPMPDVSNSSFRLVSSTGSVITAASTIGRLEYRPNASAAWGSICGAVNPTAASLACVAMGFASYNSRSTTSAASASQPVYMANVLCLGNETNFDDCPRFGESQVGLASSCTTTTAGRASISCRALVTSATTTTTAAAATTAGSATAGAAAATTTATNAATTTTTTSAPVIATTAAPPTTQAPGLLLGARVVSEQLCTCTCAAGFFGTDCSAPAAMTTAASSFVVSYTGTQLTFADRDVIAQGAATILQDAAITMTVSEARSFGGYHEDVVTAVSARRDSAAESAAVLVLLSPANLAELKALIVATAPTTTILNVAMASFVLRGRRSNTYALTDAMFASGSPLTTGAVSAYTASTSVPTTTTNELVTQLSVTLNGVRATSSSAQIEVTGAVANWTSTCTPNVFNGDGGCAARTTCTLAIPNVPTTEGLQFRLTALTSTCDTTTARALSDGSTSGSRQLLQSTTNGSSIEVEATTQSSLPSDPPRSISALQTDNFEGAMLLTLIILLGTGLFGVLASCAILVVRGKRVLALTTHTVALIAIGFYIYFAVASRTDIGTSYVPNAYAFFDEYRSDRCNASNTTAVPHRVSTVPADGVCHRMLAYGTSEQPYYVAALCGPDSVYVANRLSVRFGKTKLECQAAEAQSIKASGCYAEGAYMIDKTPGEQQFFRMVCTNATLYETRKELIEQTLDPIAEPNVEANPLQFPASDRMYQGVANTLWFFIGEWRSTATRFFFDKEEVDSESALATFSESDVAAGRVGLPVDIVQSRGQPPATLQLNDGASDGGASSFFSNAASPSVPASNTSTATTAASSASAMAALGPLFNNFGTAAGSTADRYGAGAMRYNNIAGTLYDIGSISSDQGFTFNFWVRATNESRGFAFLTTDAWMESDGVSPIAKRLATLLDNPSRKWFQDTWAAYSALYLDGAAGSISLLYRNPDVIGGNSETMVWDNSEVILDLFDDNWHFIAVTGALKRGRIELQLFIDGRTSYTQFAYRACLAQGATIPAVRALPPLVPISNADAESVFDGGVAFVGHINAGMFGFMVHDRALEHQVIVSLGANHMEERAAIATGASRVSAAGFLGGFILLLLVSLAQIIMEVRETAAKAGDLLKKEEKDGNKAAGNAAKGEAKEAAKAGKEAGNLSGGDTGAGEKLIVIIPIFMSVCQNMTLYFQGWQWPLEFQLTFEWIYFPFSLDFFVVPSIPVWVTYAVQFGIAFAALMFVFQLAKNDRLNFQQEVIDTIAEEGLFPEEGAGFSTDASLPQPEIDDPATQLSVLQFEIDGNQVVGAVSRFTIQNSCVQAMLDENRPEPVFDPKNPDAKSFMTVLMTKGLSVDIGSGVPKYLAQLAQSPDSIEEKLQLCGFTYIATLPNKQNNLLTVYNGLSRDYDELHLVGTSAAGLSKAVDLVSAHYTIATSIFKIAPTLLKRAIQMYKNMNIDMVREDAEAEHPDDDDEVRAAVGQAEGIDYDSYILTTLIEDPDVETAYKSSLDADKMEAEFEDQSTTAKADSEFMREMEHRSAIDGQTIMKAAYDAGIKIHFLGNHQAGDDEIVQAHRDADVISAIARESPMATGMIKALQFIMNPRTMHGYDYLTLSEQKNMEEVADKTFRILVGRLVLAHGATSKLLDQIRGAELATGYVRVDYDIDRDNIRTPKWTFNRIDPLAKEQKPKKLKLVPSKTIVECPIHSLHLIPQLPDIHGRVRATDPDTVYRCAHRANQIVKSMQMAARSKADQNKARPKCNLKTYYVCTDDTCNFSICAECAQWSRWQKIKAEYWYQKMYLLRREGATALIGLLMILAAQAMYQPAIKSAITTVFCHSSLLCHYPDCYSPARYEFLSLSIGSMFVLLFLGIGLVWFLFMQVYERKKAILNAGILEPYVEKGGEEFTSDGKADVGDVFGVTCEEYPGHEPYKKMLSRDKSMFKGLYEQYEFKWMVVHPITFLFKVMLLLVVLYAGEPNSLRLVVGCGFVEGTQLLFFVFTNPYTDPWLDILQKAGSLHQVAQLGLMCIYRADSYEDPDDRRAAYAMIAFAVAYLVLMIIVLLFVVAIPAFKAWRAKKKAEKEAAENHSDDDNDDEPTNNKTGSPDAGGPDGADASQSSPASPGLGDATTKGGGGPASPAAGVPLAGSLSSLSSGSNASFSLGNTRLKSKAFARLTKDGKILGDVNEEYC